MVSKSWRRALVAQRLLWTIAALGSVQFSLLATSARAERPPAPQMLPDTTVVYVRVGDAQETVAKFQETSIGRMFQDPQVAPLVQNLYGSAQEAFREIEDKVGLTLDELLAIPQGELCFAVIAPPERRPQLAVIIDVKDRMPEFDKLLGRAFEEAGQRGSNLTFEQHGDHEITTLSGARNRGLHICTREGVALFASDLDIIKLLLDMWDGRSDVRTLAENRRFRTIMAQSVGTRDERPQISWYADPLQLFRSAGAGNAGAQIGLALLVPLGLDGLAGLGGSVVLATEEFDSITHMHVLMDSPRSGVLEMVALGEGDPTPQPWVPEDVASYMTLYWDFATTFGELARIYDIIQFEEGAFANAVRERVSYTLGVDFEKEVLPNLTGRVTMLTRIQPPIRLNSESTLIAIEVRDAAVFRPIFDKFVEKQGKQLERHIYGAETYYKVVRAGGNNENSQRNVDTELTRIPEPAVMLLDDHLVFSDNTKLIEQCIVTRNQPGTSLADDPEFQFVIDRIAQHAGDRPPGLIGFARPEENLRAMYDFINANSTRDRLSQAAANNRFFGAVNRALTENPLPPFEVIAKYLAPSGSMGINNATGLHYITFGLRRE